MDIISYALSKKYTNGRLSPVFARLRKVPNGITKEIVHDISSALEIPDTFAGGEVGGLQVYGNTVENGTGEKSLTNPYTFEHVGETIVTITSQDKDTNPTQTDTITFSGFPLRKIGMDADVLDFDRKKVIRKVFRQIIDAAAVAGTNSVINQTLSNESVTFLRVVSPHIAKAGGAANIICDKLPSGSYNGDPTNAIILHPSPSTTGCYVRLLNTELGIDPEDAPATKHAKFRAWFDTHTLEVMYLVATPFEEDVPSAIANQTLATYDGSTFITASGELLENIGITVVEPILGKNQVKLKSQNYAFVPELITGVYKSSNAAYDLFSYDYTITTITDYHDAWQDLVSAYPDYVTVTNLGTDASETYPIYQYHFSPEFPQITGKAQPKRLPKILIASNMHGEEKTAPFALYYMFNDIINRWQTDPVYEYLRFNVEFIIIPSVNPWGFMHNTRKNANGVDLNRNFPYNWTLTDPSSSNYGGPEPLSEPEAQYVANLIDSNLDAIFYIDYHLNGSSGQDWNKTMWISLCADEYFDQDVADAAKYHVSKMTRELIKDYELPDNVGFMGLIDYGTTPTSKWYAAIKGVKSCTFEASRKFPSDETYYLPHSFKANTEIFANWILAILRKLYLYY